MEYQIGQMVQYVTPEGKWFRGKVHGVQNHETPAGMITARFYLIDTGRDVRQDIITTPKGEPDTVIRQPEQVTVSEEFIKPLKG